jgi:hypothetical protein
LSKFKRIKFILVLSISCYKCSSINGSNPSCEDSFQGDIAGKTSLLQTPCLTNLRGRKGFFPATHCIKLIAHSRGKIILISFILISILLSIEPNSTQYVYRTCSRDEGDDNGITRASHCGFIKLEWINPHQRFRGCLHICERDACNQAYYLYPSIWKIIFSLNLLLFFIEDY